VLENDLNIAVHKAINDKLALHFGIIRHRCIAAHVTAIEQAVKIKQAKPVAIVIGKHMNQNNVLDRRIGRSMQLLFR